jgi:hypothetical protein
MEADAVAKSLARPTVNQTARPGAYQVGTSSPRDGLTRMESDIAAKSRPAGAPPAASRSAGFNDRLSQKEREAEGKTRSAGATPSGRADLAELDSDVIAKSLARPPSIVY